MEENEDKILVEVWMIEVMDEVNINMQDVLESWLSLDHLYGALRPSLLRK